MNRQGEAVDLVVGRLAARNIRVSRLRERIASAAASREGVGDDPGRHLGPYIAVSRLHGAGGLELAQKIGATLGWPVLDQEVVDLMASHLHLAPAMIELLGRDGASWVTDVLSYLLPTEVISRDRFTRELQRAVQLLAVHGHVIYLGRAAHLFLPRDRGLAIRVVAGEAERVARIRARDGSDVRTALRDMTKIDRVRARFVSRTFGRDVADPLLYDLVLNSSTLSLDVLSDLVVAACRRRWPRYFSPATNVA